MAALLERYGPRRIAAVSGAAAAALLVAVVAILVFSGGSESPQAAADEPPSPGATSTATALPTETPEASPTPILHAGILDGMPMSEAEWQERKDRLPLAVMIDNTVGAVPHAGLDRADLVYEAFVEGGITRLMAVYWRQDADRILPVRSARTPFLIWASELDAMYSHAGGAQTDNDANAIGQIVEWDIRDLNAFSPVSSNYYYRDSERRGPYDLATNTAYLLEAAGLLGYAGPPAVESWKFREPGSTLPPGVAAGGIEIDFSGRSVPWQYIQWQWDQSTRSYLRFQFGGEQRDAVTGGHLAFATVIVMQAEGRVVDESGHVVLDQFGDGPATVFTAGRAFEGTWRKPDRQARTRFFDASGAEIVFERGPVFIEVIGRQSRFAFTPTALELPPMPAYEPPPPGAGPVDPEPEEETPTPEPSATPTETPAPQPTATPTSGTPTATPTPTIEPTPTVDPTL